MPARIISRYANITIEKKPESLIVITGEIPAAALDGYRARALKSLGAQVTLPGFRKGHIPEKVLVERIGEQRILEEIAESALSEAYPAIVAEHHLHVIGHPRVTLTKLAPGNPIGFAIESAVLPEVTLPDYRKISAAVMAGPDDVAVTDADVEKVILEVRRGRARLERIEKGKDADTGNKPDEPKDEELPELDDAFVRTLGDFQTVADFTARVREDVAKDKAARAQEKKRVLLSERLIEETPIEVPQVLIENELNKMMAQMEDDVARVNMSFDDYLAHVKKTRDDLRTEWRDQAKKRATLQLVLNAIAEKEQIKADHDEIHQHMDRILKRFPDANSENVHAYAETQLTNEAVFTFLEKTT